MNELQIGQSVPGLGSLVDFRPFKRLGTLSGWDCLIVAHPSVVVEGMGSQYRIMTWFKGNDEPSSIECNYNNFSNAVNYWLSIPLMCSVCKRPMENTCHRCA